MALLSYQGHSITQRRHGQSTPLARANIGRRAAVDRGCAQRAGQSWSPKVIAMPLGSWRARGAACSRRHRPRDNGLCRPCTPSGFRRARFIPAARMGPSTVGASMSCRPLAGDLPDRTGDHADIRSAAGSGACAWRSGRGQPLDDTRLPLAQVILNEIRTLPAESLGLPMPRDPRLIRIANA